MNLSSMTLMAMLTSSSLTNSLKCMFARLCDHALNVPDCDRDGPGGYALPPQLGVHLGHILLVQLGVDLLPGVQDVLPQQLPGNFSNSC